MVLSAGVVLVGWFVNIFHFKDFRSDSEYGIVSTSGFKNTISQTDDYNSRRSCKLHRVGNLNLNYRLYKPSR